MVFVIKIFPLLERILSISANFFFFFTKFTRDRIHCLDYWIWISIRITWINLISNPRRKALYSRDCKRKSIINRNVENFLRYYHYIITHLFSLHRNIFTKYIHSTFNILMMDIFNETDVARCHAWTKEGRAKSFTKYSISTKDTARTFELITYLHLRRRRSFPLPFSFFLPFFLFFSV